MYNQSLLNNYFSNSWCPSTEKYIYSGYAIADKITTESVIDIGCGTNPFAGHINNLVGIDPANDNADIVTTIENFNTSQKFDVALCLGSINFGNTAIIANQIKKVNALLNQKARVFWRLNPGQHDHVNKKKEHISACDQIDFYPWSFEELDSFAEQYGFTQRNCAYDTNGDHMRLYAEWHRN